MKKGIEGDIAGGWVKRGDVSPERKALGSSSNYSFPGILHHGDISRSAIPLTSRDFPTLSSKHQNERPKCDPVLPGSRVRVQQSGLSES